MSCLIKMAQIIILYLSLIVLACNKESIGMFLLGMLIGVILIVLQAFEMAINFKAKGDKINEKE